MNKRRIRCVKFIINNGNLYGYNAKGLNTYYENLKDGYWFKMEYNAMGNCVYHINSYGYWIHREFDANGNKTFFRDSEGVHA